MRTTRPAGPPRKLIATIGEQLARYGPRAPQLWLPPLDEPIPLTAVLARAGLPQRQWRWPLGEIDKPFEMRRDPLIFDATSSAGNMVIHGGAKSGKSTALQTFIMSAASLHSPRDVTFYCLDYGGGQLRALEDLAHVGSVASPLEPERIRRTFGELEQLLLSRQQREAFRDRRGNVTATVRPPTTASARCSWSSTTSTRSAATTPTSSTPVIRCWPR